MVEGGKYVLCSSEIDKRNQNSTFLKNVPVLSGANSNSDLVLDTFARKYRKLNLCYSSRWELTLADDSFAIASVQVGLFNDMVFGVYPVHAVASIVDGEAIWPE